MRFAAVFCLCFKEGLTISKNDLQINEQIRDNEIRVVSADGEQLGVMSAKEAQDIAYEKGMDLVKMLRRQSRRYARLWTTESTSLSLISVKKKTERTKRLLTSKRFSFHRLSIQMISIRSVIMQ